MHADTLRSLDRLAGAPLCWIFTQGLRLVRLVRPPASLPSPQKVLIIKLSEMGSTVLALPALAELRSRRPEIELFFLVFRNNADIFSALDLAPPSNIITVDTGSLPRLMRSGLAALMRLRNEGIDTTIDMDFFSRFSALASFLISRGNRVGHHRYADEGLYRGNLLTHRAIYSPHVHTAATYMALIRTLFEKPDDEPHYRGRIELENLAAPRYAPLPEEIKSVREKLVVTLPSMDRQPLILINPNSSDIFPLRKWPLDLFARLCEQLLVTVPTCRLVITGVAAERRDAEHILRHVQSARCVDFTGKTTFRELLALYSIASLMITNDSGPAHFASLLHLPTVVLFGPETPRLYGPLGDRHRDLYSGFACSPCVSVHNAKKSPCEDNRCLQSITVEQVLKAALDLCPDLTAAPEPLS